MPRLGQSMLPTRLLSYRQTDDGVVMPTWLTARDDVWLGELAAEAAASDGRRVDVADERIFDLVGPVARRHGASRRIVEAVWFVERRRWKTRVDAPVPPERIRRVVFDLRPRPERRQGWHQQRFQVAVGLWAEPLKPPQAVELCTRDDQDTLGLRLRHGQTSLGSNRSFVSRLSLHRTELPGALGRG